MISMNEYESMDFVQMDDDNSTSYFRNYHLTRKIYNKMFISMGAKPKVPHSLSSSLSLSSSVI